MEQIKESLTPAPHFFASPGGAAWFLASLSRKVLQDYETYHRNNRTSLMGQYGHSFQMINWS